MSTIWLQQTDGVQIVFTVDKHLSNGNTVACMYLQVSLLSYLGYHATMTLITGYSSIPNQSHIYACSGPPFFTF